MTFRFLFILIVFSCSNTILAQTDNNSSDFNSVIGLMKHVNIFNKTYPQEKAYLHFDNTAYFKGERMFFKAYVTRTDNGKMTDISSVLYVDLLNPSGDVIRKCKLKLENGQAHGDILLDSIYEIGFFEVRAYTRYMLNFGDDAVFSRVLPVFKKPVRPGDYDNPVIDYGAYHRRLPDRLFVEDSVFSLDPVKMKRKNSRGYHVNFYPEGGKLVKNVESRVAFTVTDDENKPVSLLGEIVDDNNNSLAIVESNSQGKGIFSLIPTSTNLFIRFTTANKKIIRFDLPDVQEEGVVLSVDPTQDDAVTALMLSSKAITGTFMAYSIMNNGEIYITDTLHLSQYHAIRINRSRLKPGVNQLTLFDTKGHIHAERLFFICPPLDYSDSIVVHNDQSLLKPCGKVKINLHTTPNSSLSFSAMDASTIQNGKYGNIKTYMLLGSDVSGFIPHPEYYFESDDMTHRLAADSLMLFNGWRRYDWQVMADVKPWHEKLQEVEDQLYVYGHIKPSLSRWKVKHRIDNVELSLFLFNDEGLSLHGETITDSTGFYAFKIPDISEKWNMQILTKINDKLKTFEVMVDRQFSPQTRFVFYDETKMIDYPFRYEYFNIDNEAFEKMNSKRTEIWNLGNNEYAISPAVIKAKTPNWRYTKSNWHDEYNAKLHSNIYYDGSLITDYYKDLGQLQPSIYEWLVEHNTLMEGFIDCDLVEGKIFGNATYNDRDITWVVDNHAVGSTGSMPYDRPQPDRFFPETSNIDMVMIPVFVEEVKSVYIWSDHEHRETPVVIYIYTHPYYNTSSKKGRRRTYFQGYDVPTKFQTEDYSLMPPDPNDYRRTLYWDPDVKTDSNGDATIEFYNNSTCNLMYFSAEGFTPDCKFITTE